MRHAGESARAYVTVTEVGEHVRVEIVNNGAAHHTDGARGNGIANMTQRARSVGGDLVAGPRDEGGFAVVAQVPIAGQEVKA